MNNMEIRVDYLPEDKVTKIEKYLNSRIFQSDFPRGYLERNKKINDKVREEEYSGKILMLKGEFGHKSNGLSNVVIGLRKGDGLNNEVVSENIKKLKKHYRNIIELIFKE